ncbi:MAG: hypothetical protein RL380_1541 [Verrucomicrobiota bacterium]
MTKTKLTRLLCTTLVTAAGLTAHAQSADALIDKLIEKGILTTKEAQDLRDEADKNFATAFATKSGMSDWVQALKFNGDVRGRFEGMYANNPLFINRDRLRYRVRFGVVAQFNDDFEAGFKLTSSDAASGGANNEGDPISGNTTFQNNGSKKLVYFDQAYGKWTPFKGPNLTGGFTVGKMENPFVTSDMVFDQDYTPEGIAGQFAYRLNDQHSLKFNGGWFVLDESSGSYQEPFLFGAQVRWDAIWNTKFSSTLGLTTLNLESGSRLVNGAVPNQQRGNARVANTELAYTHNPIIVDGALTWTLASAPFYTGPFPIKFMGEYMSNPGAPSAADNYGYNLGVSFGKSGKRHTWQLDYNYKWLGADAMWEEFSDSDFGAFYAAANSPANSGGGIGYGSGTNVKGHIFRFAYSPTDSFTLGAKWFHTSLINNFPGTSDSDIDRLQVDALWKF